MTWSRFSVSADRTHHIIDGTPAYTRRFLDVLSFHAPGLAAVHDESGAFHILPTGADAYDVRFAQTFGFYDERAAVDTGSGWVHVNMNGEAICTRRFAWCGNFQGSRCAVRDAAGKYFRTCLASDGRGIDIGIEV